MKYLNWNEVNELAVKQQGQLGVFINNSLDYSDNKDLVVWMQLQETIEAIHGGKHGDYFDYVGWLVAGGLAFYETEDVARWVFDVLKRDTQDSSFYMALYSPEVGFVDDNN